MSVTIHHAETLGSKPDCSHEWSEYPEWSKRGATYTAVIRCPDCGWTYRTWHEDSFQAVQEAGVDRIVLSDNAAKAINSA